MLLLAQNSIAYTTNFSTNPCSSSNRRRLGMTGITSAESVVPAVSRSRSLPPARSGNSAQGHLTNECAPVNDPCWTPPNAQGVVGDWWEEYARRRKLTWEMGLPVSRNQYGGMYTTLMWYGAHHELEPAIPFYGPQSALIANFERNLDEFLGPHTHIVWRCFPRLRELPRHGLELRARLSSYPVKPVTPESAN